MARSGVQPGTTAAPSASALSGVPAGYRAVSLMPQQCDAPLRLCVLAREEPDPVLGHFVVLNDTIDTRVVLGCVIDAGGVVQKWIELWLQDLQGLSQTLLTCREALDNEALDERWCRNFESMELADARSIVRTGWETSHPLPLYVNTTAWTPVNPVHADSGKPWALCCDDAALKAASLPGYADSLHRYLYVPELGDKSPFIALTDEAPPPPKTGTISGGDNAPLVALNPSGGYVIAREYNPLDFEIFIDMLGGKRIPPNLHGRSSFNLTADLANAVVPGTLAAGIGIDGLEDGQDDLFNYLFLATRGMAGSLLEVFHLKLRALADAIAALSDSARMGQRPLLNVSPQTFRVRMAPRGCGLPRLWTAGIGIAAPGDAIELSIPGTQTTYYLPGRADAISIYRPSEAGRSLAGRASLRIRQLLTEAAGLIIEGTLSTPERLHPARNDLVRLRVPLGGGRVDLYARLESQSAMAAGELRFRTVPQRFGDQTLAQLRAAEGVPIGFTSFELIPLLSTPCDLYSIAVIAVRTLLVNGQATLPVALDETLSLARQLAHDYDESTPVAMQIRAIFERDKRWIAALGPHRLVHELLSPEQASDSIPPELWFGALSVIVQMFAGMGPASTCRDYGDAPPGGVHHVFERSLAELESLLVRTRSLIVIDWRDNREIQMAIRGALAGLGAMPSPAESGNGKEPIGGPSPAGGPGPTPTTQPAPATPAPPSAGIGSAPRAPARGAAAPTIAPAPAGPRGGGRGNEAAGSPFANENISASSRRGDGKGARDPKDGTGKAKSDAAPGGGVGGIRMPSPQPAAPRRQPPQSPPQQQKPSPSPPQPQPQPSSDKPPSPPQSQPVRLPWSDT